MDQVGEQKEVGSPILLAIHSLLATFDLQGFQKTFLVVEVQSLDHSLDIWIDSQKIVVLQSRDLWNVVITSLTKLSFLEVSFLKISRFLRRIPMEYVDIKDSSDSGLQFYSICSIRIPSRNGDISKIVIG